MNRVSDLHILTNVPLPAPTELIREIPTGDDASQMIAASRSRIRSILSGESARFLVIVGPCSIHDTVNGLEYAMRLKPLATQVSDVMEIVMRVYFEKPRTTVGWKGLIMDPKLDGSHDIAAGLRLARGFLRDVTTLGLPTASELLDPITPQYIADFISWSAIGARTTESQTHRQMASGLSMPLGFKNSTSGDVQSAINAIKAARQPQTFLGVNENGVASAVSTLGNPDCHLILRGGSNGPNYHVSHVLEACNLLIKNDLRPSIMVDASHDNCAKDHNLMPSVCQSIISQRIQGDTSIIGIMVESNLTAGSQKFPAPLGELVPGQSITDPCINWETTETLLLQTAESLRRSRASI